MEKQQLSYDQALEEAVSFHREGATNDAERLYLELIKKFPDKGDPSNLLGVLYSQKEEYSLAAQHIENAIKICSTVSDWYKNLISIYIKMNLGEKALLLADQQIELSPDDCEGYKNKSILVCKVNGVDLAIEYLQSLNQNIQSDLDITIQLSVFYNIKQDWSKSIALVQPIFDEFPNDPESLEILAKSHFGLKEF